MSAQRRYVTIAVSLVAWSGVLLVVTYWSHTSVVFGQYSWGPVTLLGFLVYTAVMAEYTANHIVSYWTKMSSRPLALSEDKSYLVFLFLSCKRVTRSLLSSGSHL